MTRIRTAFVYAALVLVVSSRPAVAQLSTAQLDGRVTDESAAVLPGATVTVTQTDTGFTRTVVTDGDGAYILPNLPTGPYRLEIMLAGFRSYAQTGIVLQVGGTPTINVQLALGGLEESVTVEAASPLVDVRSAGISEVVENERIVELPLQGREVTSLLLLAGASTQQGVNVMRTVNGGARIAVAGGLSYGVTYLLDGTMHTNPGDNLNLPLPFPDALQEFSVSTSGLSAQNGVHSGAAVNAVTKSGTNRFSGNAFDFMRDKRFNATDPYAQIGPEGRRMDDGLSRHQYGGTLGGPVLRDRLFFFGAYQGTRVRSVPVANIAWVPTPAMLAGDFTTFASPACAGRQVALRAPFVNNRVDPTQFSPAALKLAGLLPGTTDPCGQVTYGIIEDSNEWQGVGRSDYQLTSDHTVFGRYLHTFVDELPVWEPGSPDANILTTGKMGRDRTALAKSLTLGDTVVFGPSMVNALRVAYNTTAIRSVRAPWVDAPSLGVKTYTAFPGKVNLSVTGGFSIGHPSGVNSDLHNNTYQVSDDLTVVKGRHQLTFGVNVAYWFSHQELNARSPGSFSFNGNGTGLGLADFLTGQLFRLEQSDPQILEFDQTYIGAYAQDSWRLTDRVTANFGVRWEPFFGQNVTHGSISNFSVERFRTNIKSTVYLNAPAGLLFPGDEGFPEGNTGLYKQWGNVSPRGGIAWDVNGDGRLAVRSSYALTYDFPPGDYQYVNAGAAPFANRLLVQSVLFDDPYRNFPGGNPFPFPSPPPRTAAFPAFSAYGTIDPDINSPRVQTWNATVEKQLGQDWGATASYLGSYSDRLWGAVALNPGVFRGLGACTINGVAYPTCTTNANLDVRRVLYQENPREAGLLGPIDRHSAVGTQDYHALKLTARRRATSLTLSGNYTLAYCVGNSTPLSPQFSSGYLKPEDPGFDRGNCEQSRTHIANLTLGVQTPDFDAPALRAVASNWRVSGIINARSGSWLSVTTNQDIAGTGISGQRVNLVSDDVYGDKSLTSYLNRAAFTLPAPGTLGDLVANSIKGPGFWAVDLGMSKLVSLTERQRLEFRVEAFNLLNNFNWGNPTTNLDSAQFGRITTNAGTQRIMQFAVKYEF
jgi:hypothetical protein